MPQRFSRFRPHPWHGLSTGARAPAVVEAYIEITPFDVVKYEVDKQSGYLRVDRPLRTSSTPPTLYGFIPRTYCGPRVSELSPGATRGDGDPLDICVISERPIARNEIVLTARVVGGLRMLDAGEADDKIVAVLESDAIWTDARELSDLPRALVDRLRHYFETYKLTPAQRSPVAIEAVYGATHAWNVVSTAQADYAAEFPDNAE
jgi:inorganic pyrophosphatase